ncbi:15125_t:CDS:2 [Racocetra fulgida]|uniref:15125_t:CDS:1 n=1 Tax=Racocetra fulgida TaxID=60492 RepID=A0A9N9NW74_9GLOM|nr:15125_t:CDS:2 [Racocetra fulgida]
MQDTLYLDDHDATFSNDKNKNIDDPQATIHQLLDVVRFENVNKYEVHLHEAYKLTLQKALKAKSKSQHLIKILQEYAKENDEISKELIKIIP